MKKKPPKPPRTKKAIKKFKEEAEESQSSEQPEVADEKTKQGEKNKMNKTILGILALFCLSIFAVDAFADKINVQNSDVMQNVVSRETSRPAVSIDGMSGEISLMTGTYYEGNQYVEPQVISQLGVPTNDQYLGCDGAGRFLWNNALSDNDDYRINRQTCKVEKLTEYKKTEKCGSKKVKWMSQLSNWVLQNVFNTTRAEVKAQGDVRFDNKVRYGACVETAEKWEVVDTSKPVQG